MLIALLCITLTQDVPLGRPIIIQVDNRQYRAILIEELESSDPKPEKARKKSSRLGWNYYLDAPRLPIAKRDAILRKLRRQNDPLYNFKSEELQAIEESGVDDETKDIGAPSQDTDPKKQESKPLKKEKMVWMEFGGAYIQVPESDYEARFDK